jgi:hypothetical protein
VFFRPAGASSTHDEALGNPWSLPVGCGFAALGLFVAKKLSSVKIFGIGFALFQRAVATSVDLVYNVVAFVHNGDRYFSRSPTGTKAITLVI